VRLDRRFSGLDNAHPRPDRCRESGQPSSAFSPSHR
jgi:hypothetical protein